MIQSLLLIFTFSFLSASTNLTESKPRIFLKTWSSSKPRLIKEPKEILKTEIHNAILIKTIMDQLVANLVTRLSQKEEPKEGPKTEPREIPTEEPKKETKPLISILRFLIKSKQIEEPKPLIAILTKSKEVGEPTEEPIKEPTEEPKKELRPALLAILTSKSKQILKVPQKEPREIPTEETKKEPREIPTEETKKEPREIPIEETKKEPKGILENRNSPIIFNSSKIKTKKTPATVKGSKMCRVYFLPHFTGHGAVPKTICRRKILKKSTTSEDLDKNIFLRIYA